MVRHTLVMRALLAAGLAFALTPASAQDKAAPEKPFKIGIVTFLSGAAAGPFGVPARNGAEVIVVESPAGSPLRRTGAQSIWGRGKRSVVLDLHTPDGQRQARARRRRRAASARCSGPMMRR